MGAAGGEDLEAAVSADNSIHERGTLGIRPLNGGDGSVGDDDTKHSRRTRDGMQSIHGDSVSSAALDTAAAAAAACSHSCSVVSRPGCARCLCQLLCCLSQGGSARHTSFLCCVWQCRRHGGEPSRSCSSLPVWATSAAASASCGYGICRCAHAELAMGEVHIALVCCHAATAGCACVLVGLLHQRHLLTPAFHPSILCHGPHLLFPASLPMPCSMQVSDPTCCDYDKRTPL